MGNVTKFKGTLASNIAPIVQEINAIRRNFPLNLISGSLAFIEFRAINIPTTNVRSMLNIKYILKKPLNSMSTNPFNSPITLGSLIK